MYNRIAPRDMFNEANMLKCCGKMALLAIDFPCCLTFDENQYTSDGLTLSTTEDGDLYVVGHLFFLNDQPLLFTRPMNSRRAWPIVAIIADEYIDIFTDHGDFTDEFKQLINFQGP